MAGVTINGDLKRGPDFVGVGPEKTGTTWIYKHLNDHPDIICSPVKELKYFWENLNYPRQNFLPRLLDISSWHTADYRRYLKNRLRHYLANPSAFKDKKRLRWDLRFLFSIHDDEWYLSSFGDLSGRFSGEISPQYFFLPELEVKRISRLLPNTKFIVSLRFPPEWAWSFTRMMVRYGKIENSESGMEKFIFSLIKEKSFTRSMQTWKDCIPEDKLKVVFFDDLQADPYKFYVEVCDFLDIHPNADTTLFSGAVNAGKKSEVPERFKQILNEGWSEEMISLKKVLPKMPEGWLTREF